eukprot:3918517-Rhodomonas_salina.1
MRRKEGRAAGSRGGKAGEERAASGVSHSEYALPMQRLMSFCGSMIVGRNASLRKCSAFW